MTKENSKVFLLILLGMLTAFGPFVTDMYLPSLPSMGEYFHTTSSMVQLGLTTSMIGLAVGQIFFGPLSDRYGRRLPLLVAMWLFIGIVISRSVATDKFSGRELAKMLAVIGAINGVAPVAAPIAGGLLTDVIGWHGIFWILLGLGVILLAGSYRFRESLPSEQRSAEKWKDTFRSFGTVLHDKRYVCYVLQMAFAQGVLFANIASSPFIVQQHYGFSAFAFSICFAVNALSIGIAAALSVKFHRPESSTLAGCCGMTVLSVLLCIALMSGCNFWIYEVLMLVLLFCMGMTFTSSTALAMESQRANSGTASALLGAVCFAAGGIVSPLVGIGNILSSTGIVFVVCACCSMGCILVALGRRRTRVYFALNSMVQKH